MHIRQAMVDDIRQMQHVRISVRENILSNPSLITAQDYETYITKRGKGWVCEADNNIVGFTIADLQENSIWALFLLPAFERQGIGRLLHDTMLNWYFGQTQKTVWLGTEPGTRAEKFYIKCGWKIAGKQKNGEIRFEMTYGDWVQLRQEHHL